jgi:hypothetical protein
VFLDGRNVFDPAKVEAAGLTYEGIGRSGRVACERPASGPSS